MVTSVEKILTHSLESSLPTILLKSRNSLNREDVLRLHSHLCHSGLDSDPSFSKRLIAFFSSLGSISDAKRVFQKLSEPCDFSWIYLFKCFLNGGLPNHVLSLHERMAKDGSYRNKSGHHFVCLLGACAMLSDLKKGLEIHAELIRMGSLEGNLFVSAALVEMYVKCGSLARAQEIFDQLAVRNVVIWTSFVAGYVECGKFDDAHKYLEKMRVEGILPNAVTCTYQLKAYGSSGDAEKIKQVHVEIEELGYGKMDIVGNTLIDMYAKCSLLAEAHTTFDEVLVRDVVSWTCLIAGYVDNGYGEKAIDCYGCMEYEGIHPSTHTIVCGLKACSSVNGIMKGQEIHTEIERRGLLESNQIVSGALVKMYIDCGYLEQAQKVFDKIPARNVVIWNMLVAGYAENGCTEEALSCLRCMLRKGIMANAITFLNALNIHAASGAIDKGEAMHAEVARLGLVESSLILGNALVNMYAQNGFLAKAEEAFDHLPCRDIVSWTTLISGYAARGFHQDVRKCFQQMQLEGITPNAITFSCSLKSVRTIEITRETHLGIESQALERGDPFVGNALVKAYAKSGSLEAARGVFEKLAIRNSVSWSTVLAGFVESGHHEEALRCCEQMQTEGMFADASSIVSMLMCCGSLRCLGKGKEAHVDVLQRGLFGRHRAVGIALLDMYAKCGSIVAAESVFDELRVHDTVSWNVLLCGYVENGLSSAALRRFEEMKGDGVRADAVTCSCCLRACAEMKSICKGQELDSEMRRWGAVEADPVLCNSLINMYAKCGSIAVARHLFDKLPIRGVIPWTCVIAGYADHGRSGEAFQCFELMQLEGISPNARTLASVLKACGGATDLEKIRGMRDEIERRGLLEADAVVGNALLWVYAKHGMLAMAEEVFGKLRSRDAVSWTALIAGYCEQGHADEASRCLRQMQLEGVPSDRVSLVCSLRACGGARFAAMHSEGEQMHCCEVAGNNNMINNNNNNNNNNKLLLLRTDLFVGTCLVDMYARRGLFREARGVLGSFRGLAVEAWTSLIAGYANHGEGEAAFEAFGSMQAQGIAPNAITMICVSNACSSAAAGTRGRCGALHDCVEKLGFSASILLGSSLVNMYAKCGLLAAARDAFRRLAGARNAVSSTALMAGYAQIGDIDSVLLLFDEMVAGDAGIRPNSVTFLVLLRACSRAGEPLKGRTFLAIMEAGYGIAPAVEHHGCLIDLVARVGLLDLALAMLSEMPFRSNPVVCHSLLGARLKFRECAFADKDSQRLVTESMPQADFNRKIAEFGGMNASANPESEGFMKDNICPSTVSSDSSKQSKASSMNPESEAFMKDIT